MDVNTASIEELMTLPEMSLDCAYDLMLWRPYLSWDELEGVPTFMDLNFARLRSAGLTLDPGAWAGWRPT